MPRRVRWQGREENGIMACSESMTFLGMATDRRQMNLKSAQAKFLRWWKDRLGNAHDGYIDKEPLREDIVDTFLMKNQTLKDYRPDLLAFAESMDDGMLQVWPGWKGGPARESSPRLH